MKKLLESLVFAHVIAVAAIGMVFLILFNIDPPAKRNICSVAEISPDVTPEERKECRMIRGHKL